MNYIINNYNNMTLIISSIFIHIIIILKCIITSYNIYKKENNSLNHFLEIDHTRLNSNKCDVCDCFMCCEK